MSATVLYVYAITSSADPDQLANESVSIDGGSSFEACSVDGLTAVYTQVPAGDFSQEVIDSHAADMEWLGAIGWRHQTVVDRIAAQSAVVPLRAFTMFHSRTSLESFLRERSSSVRKLLARLAGKEEWSVRIDFIAERWSEALVERDEVLRNLGREVAAASGGKKYLLERKLADAKKDAARDAEEQVVGEIEAALASGLDVPTIVGSRQKQGGSSPQIDLLVPKASEETLLQLVETIAHKYSPEGISLALSGPWPPYSFASEEPIG